MSELHEFAENVWIVDGPNVRDCGVMFTTRMTIVRLSDGSIWVSSPVPAAFDTLMHIAELGPVRYLVAGTPRHVWRLEGWRALFPEAELWASPPTPFTLKKGRLPLTSILGNEPPPGWADDLSQLAFAGRTPQRLIAEGRIRDLVVEFDRLRGGQPV